MATVDVNGLVTAVGLGGVDITATNGGRSGTVTISVVVGSVRVSDGLVVLYTFQEGQGAVIRDVSGVGEPLDMTMSEPELVNWIPEGLEVPVPSLRAITTEANGATVRPATKVIEGCKATNEITVEVWITPYFNDSSVGGPARILSLAADQGIRNWSLLQSSDFLRMRIRTTVGQRSGGIPGGNRCSLARALGPAPCGLDSALGPFPIELRLHHVVYTRDASGVATFYIDGQVSVVDRVNFAGDFSDWADDQGLMVINENVLQDGARESRDWRGIYHLAAVYNRALTPEEVTLNFELGRTGCPEVTTVSHASTQAIVLASIDVPTELPVTVAIPDLADGTVTVTSANPAVAANAALAFNALAGRCASVLIDVTGVGDTTFDLSNDMGFANGPSRTVRVIPARSIDLQLSTAAMEIGDSQQAIVMGDFGAAGLRDISDGARFGTRYTSSDPAVATVDETTGVIKAVGVGTVDVSATHDTTDTETIFVAERLTRIAFLVGAGSIPTPNEGDRAVLDLLNALRFSGTPGQIDPNGLPPRIRTLSEADFDAAAIDAEFDLLITSSTVSSGNVAGKFRCQSIPHIFWEQALNQTAREGLTNGSGSRDAADLGECSQGLFVLDASHPITQGFTDPNACVDVFDSPQTQSYSGIGPTAANGDTLAPGARRLAESIFIDEATIIVAEAGGARVDGSPIPGRRVFLWLVDDSADNLNDTGREIFTRSVNWALAGQRVGADALVLSGPAQMRVGFCVQLAARATNAGGACARDVTFAAATRYSSSDPSVAMVDDNGLVRGEAAGTVTITATNGGLQSTARIEVGGVVGRVTDGLVALYEFQEGQGGIVTDTSGVGVPLHLFIPDQNVVNWLPGGGLAVIAPSPAIISGGPATKIIDACTASNELTVEAWIKPASLAAEIDGPARIVSCSIDSGNRNFSVLQEFMPGDGTARTQARLRTTSSGNNGSISYDTVTGITTDLQHVVFTRDASGASHIYVDAVDMAIDTGNTFAGDLSNWDAGYRLMLANEDVSDLTSRDWQGEYHLVAIYSKALTADEVAQNFGIPRECPPRVVPELLRIAGGLGGVNRATGLADSFISPLGEACALTSFSLEANEPLTLDVATVTYTGAGPMSGVTLVNDGGGRHTIQLEPSPEPGEWVKIELDVTGAGGGNAVLTVWVAHQPLDITQDGRTNIRDATAFGDVFRGDLEARLIDVNCDGRVNVQDATAFGNNWNGVGTSRRWADTDLPPKP